jgi:hypothetical protein
VYYAEKDDIVAYMKIPVAIAVLNDGTTVKLLSPIISQGEIAPKIWNEDGGYWDLDYENEKVISLSELKRLIFPEGIVIKGGTTESLFSGCENLDYVELSHDFPKIGKYMFYGCSALSSITISDSVSNIEHSAFQNCSSLTSITIPDSVSNIEHSAFQNCSSLTSINIPDSVESIGSYAFDGTNLSSVIIGSGLTNVGEEGIFGSDGNSSIRSVTLRDGLGTIPRKMFFGWSAFSSITIPDSVMSIGNSAFAFCSSLTSITIPNSVTSIGSSAFSDCKSLTSITIPDSVTSIGDYAFYLCSRLSSITIGSGVTTIGSKAFLECYSLHTIIVMSTHEINLKNALGESEIMGPYTIYVPSSKVDYYNNHFADWKDVTIIGMS